MAEARRRADASRYRGVTTRLEIAAAVARGEYKSMRQAALAAGIVKAAGR